MLCFGLMKTMLSIILMERKNELPQPSPMGYRPDYSNIKHLSGAYHTDTELPVHYPSVSVSIKALGRGEPSLGAMYVLL